MRNSPACPRAIRRAASVASSISARMRATSRANAAPASVFQQRDLPCQRRLGDTQRLRGAPKMLHPRDHMEITELP
jgi:hypothetical protein